MPDTLASNFHCLLFPPTETRYVRYTVPGSEEMMIGEIEVYADSACTRRIACEVTTSFDRYHHPERVTDGDIESFFFAPLECRTIELSLDTVSKVEAIGFVPRNNDNFVWPGQRYKLMYFDSAERGWVPVGETVPDGRVIKLPAPQGALYWLRNLSQGREEEVFIWRRGRQVFAHDL